MFDDTCLISADFPPEVGGVQTYALELARRLARDSKHFSVLTPQSVSSSLGYSGQTLQRHDAGLDFQVFRCSGPRNLFALSAAQHLYRFRRSPQLLLHTLWHSAIAWSVPRRPGALLAVAAHGRELRLKPLARVSSAQRLYDRLRQRTLQQANLLLPVSGFASQELEALGCAVRRIAVVPNGVDTERFRPAPAGDLPSLPVLRDATPVVLSVGRLMPHKGFDSVLACLPRLQAQFPKLSYVIAGNGPDRPRLGALAKQLGVENRVLFAGRVSDQQLPQLYNRCDLFVMPSREQGAAVEGFGLCFMEAAACGKAVIGTNSGGIGDAVRHKETGLLVEPDDGRALECALHALLTDPRLRQRLGEQAREHALAHTWDKTYAALTASIERARAMAS